MGRFFGMMNMCDVSIEKTFKDKNNKDVIIQAGKTGWSVLWHNGSSVWKDENNTAEDNFNIALKTAEESVGTLTEYINPDNCEE